jgi:predicted transcriptional regulator
MAVEELKDRSERLEGGVRLREIERLARQLEDSLPEVPEGVFTALGLIVTDATLDWDEEALGLILEELPRLAALARLQGTATATLSEGRLLGLIDITRHGLQRALPIGFLGRLEPDSLSHRFLQEIERDSSRSSSDLVFSLNSDESSVSRVGRKLIDAGLARKRQLGRTNQWLITPRGLQALRVLETGGIERPTREQYQIH